VYGNEDTISFFFIFETGPAQICGDLLEIRIDQNELTDMLLMYGQCYHVIRMQRRAISRKTPSWATSVINLVEVVFVRVTHHIVAQ
jgi:hypothetical protein